MLRQFELYLYNLIIFLGFWLLDIMLYLFLLFYNLFYFKFLNGKLIYCIICLLLLYTNKVIFINSYTIMLLLSLVGLYLKFYFILNIDITFVKMITLLTFYNQCYLVGLIINSFLIQ